MPKIDLILTNGDYATVAERIALFYQKHPTGRIVTDLVSDQGGRVVMRASVYRTTSESGPSATGWAAEREDDSEINAVACIENTETSAVGRALANLGFAASSRRPSLEEMLAAACRRVRSSSLPSETEATVRVREERRAATTSAPRPAAAASLSYNSELDPYALNRHADEVMDLLDLLRVADRLAFPPRRGTLLRRRAVAGEVDRQRLARLCHRLRGWIRRATVASLAAKPRSPGDK